MDARTFDQLTAEAARRPTRRAALRLLAGSLLGGLLSWHTAASTRAAQVDVVGPPSQDLLCAAQGLDDCGGVCVNLFTDPFNCGACAWVCESFQTCSDGMCLTPAPSPDTLCAAQGLTNCSGVCANLSADPYNCGTCGWVCESGVSCSGGVCLAPAPSSDQVCAAQGLTNCGGVCTNTLNDNANCGACGNSCPLGGYCEGGACVGTVCLSGLVDCGTGYCADLSADPNHCGACGNSCPLGGYCQGGVCTGLVCLDGLTDCYGRCVDLSTDSNYCGGCEFGCIAGATCVNGACVD